MFTDNPPRKIFLDASRAPLADKIQRCQGIFFEATKRTPNLCAVPPEAAANGLPEVDGLHIFTSTLILPNCIWLGIAEEQHS